MDPWTWNETLWALGFLGITYMPLQCVALWKCRGGARVAAAFPLLVMSAMLVFDFQPLDYDIGSRTAMYFVCPYLPAMIFLIVLSFVSARRPSLCPHCGHQTRAKSFQMTSYNPRCQKCGYDLLANPADQCPREK